MRSWIHRLAPAAALVCGLLPALALARVGGGEHYVSSDGPLGRSGDDGGGGELLFDLVFLLIRHPSIGVPVLIVVGLVYLYRQTHGPAGQSQRGFQQQEAVLRTTVSAREVTAWVNALKLKDPAFELLPFLDRVRQLATDLQQAWFRRDLQPVRAFLSDATYQRFETQLGLLDRQGVRDAVADFEVVDLQLLGLAQNDWFDTLHVRVTGRARDADVPKGMSDAQALAAASKAAPEEFVEVWSFVRKPGAKTTGALAQGKCPSCGAPYPGGASNRCEYCSAVVNSGNYDWTLAEITQGVEHIRHYATVDGLRDARLRDPALNLEVLEDRVSLIFWKWVDAQSSAEPRLLAKLANGSFVTQLEAEVQKLRTQRRRKVFLECAVGGVTVRAFRTQGEWTEATVDLRWSARMGIGPESQPPPALPVVPQRWIFTLARKVGATTPTEHGLSTHRCPQCHAPLTASAAPTCDYCGVELASGARDWVLVDAAPFEAWDAREQRRFEGARAPRPGIESVRDPQERERLLFMMTALAQADGLVDARERNLLQRCAERWHVPWSHVEAALQVGPDVFDHFVAKASPEAESMMRALVQMAELDGHISDEERTLLQTAAQHLGLTARLPEFLPRS